jgi:predicted nicotinamide N-methyase
MKKHCDEAELMYSGALMAEALGNDDEAIELRLIGDIFQQAHAEEELLFDGKEACTETEAEIIFSDLLFRAAAPENA